MIRLPFVAGHAPVHHCRLIGADPRFQALRERNDARLAALKASKQLHEDKHKNASPATTGHPAQHDHAAYQRALNAQLAAQQNASNGYYPSVFGGFGGPSSLWDDWRR